MVIFTLITPKNKKIKIYSVLPLYDIESLKKLIEEEYGFDKKKIVIKLKSTETNGLSDDFYLEKRNEFYISNMHFSSIKKLEQVHSGRLGSEEVKEFYDTRNINIGNNKKNKDDKPTEGNTSTDDNTGTKKKREFFFDRELPLAPRLDPILVEELTSMGYSLKVAEEACKRYSDYSKIIEYLDQNS